MFQILEFFPKITKMVTHVGKLFTVQRILRKFLHSLTLLFKWRNPHFMAQLLFFA